MAFLSLSRSLFIFILIHLIKLLLLFLCIDCAHYMNLLSKFQPIEKELAGVLYDCDWNMYA